MELRKTFRFEASHILPKHKGKCSRLHGHSWVLHVFVEGVVNEETGFVMDYAEISEVVKPLIEALDHRHLGAFPQDTLLLWKPEGPDISYPDDIYPSSENLLIWIGSKLYNLQWSKLALEETCTSYCELTRDEFERIT
jgi:6-pyruvoyltetrahydropterin/6-carboxytetrahydropterin synthase